MTQTNDTQLWFVQITEITRGYRSAADRDLDIKRLQADGFDHFVLYRDTQAPVALCYARTPRREIQHLWGDRHDATARERIRYDLRVLRNQRHPAWMTR